jgi:hypothetical protein
MESVVNRLRELHRLGRKLAPYLMVEMLLPGGTLIALILFLCRDGRIDTGGIAVRAGVAFAKALKQWIVPRRPFVPWPAHAYHPAGRAVYDGGFFRP